MRLGSKAELSWCGDPPFWPVVLHRWQRRRTREGARRRETKRDWERRAWRRPRPHAFCGQAEGQHWHSSHAETLQAWGFCSTNPSPRDHVIPINISAWFGCCLHKVPSVDCFVLSVCFLFYLMAKINQIFIVNPHLLSVLAIIRPLFTLIVVVYVFTI